LEIAREAPSDIVWKRVCRVIADINANDAEFARYKNDPIVSHILNKIMRSEPNAVAPFKMATIHNALIKMAKPFSTLFDQKGPLRFYHLYNLACGLKGMIMNQAVFKLPNVLPDSCM
jgi:hypothetical protein